MGYTAMQSVTIQWLEAQARNTRPNRTVLLPSISPLTPPQLHILLLVRIMIYALSTTHTNTGPKHD